mmetsp:Transcript_123784/g.174507  ORF Transcript_123784/g.174507 Transcript_123784/m.174507 type:complete len:155 (+) Transcript_123784:84-548(+)
MSSHYVMKMLLAVLLAFTARTSAEEETKMNVSGNQMVQELTKANMSIGRNHSVATSNDPMSQSKALLRGTGNHRSNRSGSAAGADVVVAPVVAELLWEDWGFGSVTGFVQCVATINSVMDYYKKKGCLPGCARTVARVIAKGACRTYCKCKPGR